MLIRFAHKTVYHTKFVMGKTRVAPLKPQTIPKLEIQAVVYSFRLQRAFIKNTILQSQRSHTELTAQLSYIGYTTLTTDRKHILSIDYTKYDTPRLLEPTKEPSRQRNRRNQDSRTQALTLDEWTNVSQVAFTFMASNYQRNHNQRPREYATIKNRRHTNLQPNLQYTAYLCGLQTILIVEKTASNYLLFCEDNGSCETTTIHSKRTLSTE